MAGIQWCDELDRGSATTYLVLVFQAAEHRERGGYDQTALLLVPLFCVSDAA